MSLLPSGVEGSDRDIISRFGNGIGFLGSGMDWLGVRALRFWNQISTAL